jgi:hypothetical protein
MAIKASTGSITHVGFFLPLLAAAIASGQTITTLAENGTAG